MGDFSQELLAWYADHKRNLPFRENRDPYRIWVSEIMAQQTRIEAMTDYFNRFMVQFPDVQALAAADDDALRKAWQGLGYYNRAANLKKAAQIVAARGFPQEKAELEKLPGIGPYTAGAIASIAFGKRAAAIDGNVLRVYARIHDIHEDVARAKTKKAVEALVLEDMRKPYGDFTQALMELGALVCIPGTPRCSICPVKAYCQSENPALLPILPEKKKKQEEEKVFVVYTDGKRIHMEKRPDKGLLAGLYGFPEGEGRGIFLGSYDHVFTHKIWHVQGWLVHQTAAPMYAPEEIDGHMAIPSAFLPLYQRACKYLSEHSY